MSRNTIQLRCTKLLNFSTTPDLQRRATIGQACRRERETKKKPPSLSRSVAQWVVGTTTKHACMHLVYICAYLWYSSMYVKCTCMHARTNARHMLLVPTRAAASAASQVVLRHGWLLFWENRSSGLAYRYVLRVRVTVGSSGWRDMCLMSSLRVRVGVGDSSMFRRPVISWWDMVWWWIGLSDH